MPHIPGQVLDHYLSQGYYRMEQDLFTNRFLTLPGAEFTVHWLRVVLAGLTWGSPQRQLLRRNARFAVAVKPLVLSEEHEALYARYYDEVVSFDTCASLRELLLGNYTESVFDSYIVEVRDDGRLIAGGIFDRGRTSLMGIVNFYDPDYRRFSLGKYVVLQKAAYAQAQRLAYYYPGYLAHGYPKFDYKLFVCEAATEVFDCLAQRWVPYSGAEIVRQSAALWAG